MNELKIGIFTLHCIQNSISAYTSGHHSSPIPSVLGLLRLFTSIVFPEFSRPFWDFCALVSNLVRDTPGQGNYDEDAQEFSEVIDRAIQEYTNSNARGGLQSAVYKLIHACDLIRTLQRRCAKYFNIHAESIDFLQVLFSCQRAWITMWLLCLKNSLRCLDYEQENTSNPEAWHLLSYGAGFASPSN